MHRLCALGAAVVALLMVSSVSAAPSKKASKANINKAKKRRAQVVQLEPIVARPMKPNVMIDISKRRMRLPARGATGFVHRIGRRLPARPF